MRLDLVRRVFYHYVPHLGRFVESCSRKWEVVSKNWVAGFAEDEMDCRRRRALSNEARAVLRIEVGALMPCQRLFALG